MAKTGARHEPHCVRKHNAPNRRRHGSFRRGESSRASLGTKLKWLHKLVTTRLGELHAGRRQHTCERSALKSL